MNYGYRYVFKLEEYPVATGYEKKQDNPAEYPMHPLYLVSSSILVNFRIKSGVYVLNFHIVRYYPPPFLGV
jgi:hypothetical protein